MTVPAHDIPLRTAIATAIAVLGNLHVLHPDVRSGTLERALRDLIDRSNDPRGAREPGHEHPAVAGVRTACEHLAVRAYEDAYLALLAAQSHFPAAST